MKNRISVSLLVMVFVTFIFVSLFRDSYAYTVEDTIKYDLYYKENQEELKNDLLNFITLVDEHIFLNSSFNLSSTLNGNYDFLTRFVISFILENEEYFEVIEGEYRTYIDDYGIEYKSNKYVNIDTLYDLTYRIFGVEYYYVLDDDLIYDNKLLLVDMNINDFNMEIDNITGIYSGDGYCDVYVKYMDLDIDYVYRFDIVGDNRLVINNLTVGE